jgi:hypothetical protein
MTAIKLYDPKGHALFQVDLSKEIARGGEGLIVPHPLNNRMVLKLYHDEIAPSLTTKSWLYLSKLDNRFVKPEQLFFDKMGELVGFSMVMLDPNYFRLSQLFSKNLCVKLGVDSMIKGKIIREMISMVEAAHIQDVIIGDFNPFNIFVTAKGEVRLLDVDSCETSAMKHSGRLLDEIRDFYYLGKVSRDSDYFALAVNIFRLLTYVHPYKGVHKTYLSLEERSLKRISVLSGDPELVIPAFYEPINNQDQLQQFEKIFNKGERFLLKDIDTHSQKVKKAIVACTAINVTIKVMATDVIDFYFNEKIGYIKKNEYTELYTCTFVGQLDLIATLENADHESIWLGSKNILVLKNKQLFHGDTLISNFNVPENFRIVQMNNMLFGVDWDNSYQIFPDKIVNGNLSWTKHATWGRGFRIEDSPMQYAGGTTWIHCQSGEFINLVKAPDNARFLKLIGNVGTLSIIENEVLKHYWVHIDGLALKLCRETDEIFSFARKQNSGSDYIFIPGDGKIDILKVPEFTLVDSMAVSMCTSQSQICFTHSGLLVLENQVLYLINRK